ncbi:MAG: hypothetical protein H6585_07360 [Flavobacteriales bacterium]|nr:hypothetical protein [Flavobacteriales bacterium]MCB9448143.1 hypothetical protein [Flavobacteriales bacterium]
MKQFSLYALLIVPVLFAPACGGKKAQTEPDAPPKKTAPVAVSANKKGDTITADGTIRDMNGKLDGCSFLIELTDSTRLEPLNLKEDMRVEGLKVRVSYEVNKSAMSICMAGTIVNILSIEKR